MCTELDMCGIEEDDLKGCTKFWQGIKNALCCRKCWAQDCKDIGASSYEDVTCSLNNAYSFNVDNLRLVKLPVLPALPDFSEGSLTCPKTDDRMLKVSSTWRTRKMDHNSSPRRHISEKSNWESFFESQSSFISTNRADKTHDGVEWADCSKTDIDMSFLEFNLEKSSIIEDSKQMKNRPRSGDDYSICTILAENSRRNDEVLFSYYSNEGMRFTFVPLDVRLEDVSTWLNKSTPHTIPISDSIFTRSSQTERQGKFSKLTLREAFQGGLDPERDGITCFLGPVEGRVSFKMSVCGLDTLQRATRDSIASPISLANKTIKLVD